MEYKFFFFFIASIKCQSALIITFCAYFFSAAPAPLNFLTQSDFQTGISFPPLLHLVTSHYPRPLGSVSGDASCELAGYFFVLLLPLGGLFFFVKNCLWLFGVDAPFLQSCLLALNWKLEGLLFLNLQASSQFSILEALPPWRSGLQTLRWEVLDPKEVAHHSKSCF